MSVSSSQFSGLNSKSAARGFPDLASREPMKAKFYEEEPWTNELENVLMPMIEKYEVVLVEDSEGLIRW